MAHKILNVATFFLRDLLIIFNKRYAVLIELFMACGVFRESQKIIPEPRFVNRIAGIPSFSCCVIFMLQNTEFA